MKKVRLHTVYKLTFPNGKVYIGIALSFKDRMRSHKHLGGKGEVSPLYHAIGKYGWESIKIDKLFEGLSPEEAYQKEIELIAEYNSRDINNGYNLAIGGRTCLGVKRAVPSWNKGKPWSEPHRAKLREAKAGKSYSHIAKINSTKYSVTAISAEGEVREYFNVTEANNDLKLGSTRIYHHISRNRDWIGGWNIRYDKQYKN